MRDLNWLPKAGILDTVDSKSKSNPSTTDCPKGRGMEESDPAGPKIDQMLFAADTAAEELVKPPSE